MINGTLGIILDVLQLAFIPLLGLIYANFKRQLTTQRDLHDIRTYIIAICEKLDITCTLKDE